MSLFSRRSPWIAVAAAFVVASLVGCSGEEPGASDPASSVIEPDDPEATATTIGPPSNQAELDLRFDYGRIVSVERIEGVDWIWFDRWTFGDQQGVELREEPRYELATDWHGGSDIDEMTRTFPLASAAQFLELDPDSFAAACSSSTAPAVDFVDSTAARLVDLDGFIALSFDDDLQVTLVRDQRGC